MYLLCKRVIKLIPGPECLQWPSISSNIVNPLDLLTKEPKNRAWT